MMKKNRNGFVALGAGVLLGFAAVTVAAITHTRAQKVVHVVRPSDTLFKKHVYDQNLLKRLQSLCAKYDTIKNAYTILGNITLQDHADTSVKMRNMPFAYCKKGNDFYYRMGSSEVINQKGLYLAIDHDSHSIVVSAQKRIEEPQGGGNMLKSISAALRSEAYNLVSVRKGSEETLSLINEHHVSCKQYSVSFDTAALGISRIYTRLTNIYEPLRKDNEKIVDLKIEKWDGSVNLGNYPSVQTIVRQTAIGRWTAVDQYTGYKIIIM